MTSMLGRAVLGRRCRGFPPTEVKPPVGVTTPYKSGTPSEINPSESEEKPDMLAAAVSYAQRGRRGFPGHWLKAGGVCSCPKGAKCDSLGKHPHIRVIWWSRGESNSWPPHCELGTRQNAKYMPF